MPASEPTVKIIPAMRVLSKREKGPVPQIIVSLVQDIMAQVNSPINKRGKVQIIGYPMMIYHDPPASINPDLADVEVVFPVDGRASVDPGFEVKTLGRHTVVSIVHTGPYSECEGTHAKAMEFILKNRLTVAGPFREIYMNGPEEVPESRLLTEIQVPIE